VFVADRNPLKALKDERSAVVKGIANTQAHLVRLQEKLESLDRAINNIEPFYEHAGSVWSPIVGEYAPGITDAVRSIFRANAELYLAPTDIRDALKKEGLMKQYDNEMAVIHQVIGRLEDQDQIRPHAVEKTYRWAVKPSRTQEEPIVPYALAQSGAAAIRRPKPTMPPPGRDKK
jgi:hypothetical protein